MADRTRLVAVGASSQSHEMDMVRIKKQNISLGVYMAINNTDEERLSNDLHHKITHHQVATLTSLLVSGQSVVI